MNILRLLFELFIIYILYKFIFDFIIPVYRTSKQMKGKMQEMQTRMRQQQEEFNRNAQAQSRPQSQSTQSSPAAKGGEYIDYEEVK
jgi:hypothetical protein